MKWTPDQVRGDRKREMFATGNSVFWLLTQFASFYSAHPAVIGNGAAAPPVNAGIVIIDIVVASSFTIPPALGIEKSREGAIADRDPVELESGQHNAMDGRSSAIPVALPT